MINSDPNWRAMTPAQIETLLAGFVVTLLNNEDEKAVRGALENILSKWRDFLTLRDLNHRFLQETLTDAFLRTLLGSKPPRTS